MRPLPELVFGHDAEVAAWVADQLPQVHDFGPCSAIGIASEGRLIAGCVYSDYRPVESNIQLSMAAVSPMWARREVVTALLRYPFRQLGVWMIYTATAPENHRALRVNRHIGIKRKTILPHHFGRKRHAVLCQMTEPEFSKMYEASNGR